MEFKRDAKRARRRAPPRRVRARALLSRNEFATCDRQTLRILAQGHHHKRGSVGCCGPSQNKNFVPYLLHPCALSAAGEPVPRTNAIKRLTAKQHNNPTPHITANTLQCGRPNRPKADQHTRATAALRECV